MEWSRDQWVSVKRSRCQCCCVKRSRVSGKGRSDKLYPARRCGVFVRLGGVLYCAGPPSRKDKRNKIRLRGKKHINEQTDRRTQANTQITKKPRRPRLCTQANPNMQHKQRASTPCPNIRPETPNTLLSGGKNSKESSWRTSVVKNPLGGLWRTSVVKNPFGGHQ